MKRPTALVALSVVALVWAVWTVGSSARAANGPTEQAVDRDMRAPRLGYGTTFKRSALALIFLVAGLLVFLGSGASVASARVQTRLLHVLSNRAGLMSVAAARAGIDVSPRY